MAQRPWDAKRVEALGAALVTAVNTARIGLAVVRKEAPEPRIVYVTEVGAEILGRPRGSIVDQPARAFLTPEERQAHPVPGPDAVQSTRTFETIALTEDGRRVPVEVTLAPMNLDGESIVVVFFRDISERRKAIDDLRQSQERFRLLLELAPDAVWITDGRQFLYVNPAAVRILGYESVAALSAIDPLTIVHPDEHPIVFARMREMIASGEAPQPREFRSRRRDGTEFLAEVQSMPIEWDGKKVILGIGRDVTGRKEMEVRLARSERLAALGTLLAGIAHEMNNPLTYVLLGVEQAVAQLDGLADASGTARLRETLEEVRQGASRVASVVGQLRASSRPVGADRARVDLQAVIEAALRVAGNELRHRARLITELEPVPAIEGNAQRLEQVVLNLLVNATQSFPDGPAGAGPDQPNGGTGVGGRVGRSDGASGASPDHGDREVRVTLRRGPGDVVTIAVSDNGSGIAAEALPRIFDPFFTTKEVGVGMGLGLSICHGIVTSYGGTIDVDSAPGRGTRFRIAFPIPVDDGAVVAVPTAPDPPAADAAPVRRRILVVDDEPALGAMIQRMLEDLFDVDVVSDARRGLELCAPGRVPYDVILCDLMMPEMTGMDFHRAVAERAPELAERFVFMTGGAFTARAAEFLATGNRVYIDKPFDYAGLRSSLDSR